MHNSQKIAHSMYMYFGFFNLQMSFLFSEACSRIKRSMSHIARKSKTNAQISFKADQCLCFYYMDSRVIIQFPFFLDPKFEASSHFL